MSAKPSPQGSLRNARQTSALILSTGKVRPERRNEFSSCIDGETGCNSSPRKMPNRRKERTGEEGGKMRKASRNGET